MSASNQPEKDPLQFLLAVAWGMQEMTHDPCAEPAREQPGSADTPSPHEQLEADNLEHTTESMAAFLEEFDQLVGSVPAEGSAEELSKPAPVDEPAPAELSFSSASSIVPQETECRQLSGQLSAFPEQPATASTARTLPNNAAAEPKTQRKGAFYAAFQHPIKLFGGAGAALLLIAAFALLMPRHQKAMVPPLAAQSLSASSLLQNTGNHPSASLKQGATFPTDPVLVSAVHPYPSRNSSQVEVSLNQVVAYEAHRISNPERVYFDLANSHLAPDLNGKTFKLGSGMITRIRMAQRENTTVRITLQTGVAFDYSAEIVPHPYRLLIHLHSQQPSRPPASGSQDEHGGGY